MQWFMIFASDVPDSGERRAAHRTAHRERIEALESEGRLLTAGPLPIDPSRPESGLSGSLIVAAFETPEAARSWADADPFRAAGVYDSVDVRPYKPVFGQTS
ncbi:YciI family protein [Guyparkeria sp.]|uniref:YciI family protein n=1 Tax=Guyparkeria sp. TaxID=2035736 RepID=UPI003561B317